MAYGCAKVDPGKANIPLAVNGAQYVFCNGKVCQVGLVRLNASSVDTNEAFAELVKRYGEPLVLPSKTTCAVAFNPPHERAVMWGAFDTNRVALGGIVAAYDCDQDDRSHPVLSITYYDAAGIKAVYTRQAASKMNY